MTTEAWDTVRRELDRWADQGLTARFWLRDDDACALSVHLTRLHALADRHDITIGLAVIPGKIERDLVRALSGLKNRFHPMCHGWNHENYGRPGEPEEFGHGRPLSALRLDAEQAYKVFSDYFGGGDAIFVPPFARITSALVDCLSQIGFAAVSTGPGVLERAVLRLDGRLPWIPVVKLPVRSPVPRIDVHIDLIDWQRRTARDQGSVAVELAANLRLRRRGFLPVNHPVGFLTHHLVHDEAIWRLCDELFGMLRRHVSVEILSAASLIRPVRQGSPSAQSKDASFDIPSMDARSRRS
jgi:peptidoglycan/xylan/chitin deacetylase (PgdA/CDA1 family)